MQGPFLGSFLLLPLVLVICCGGRGSRDVLLLLVSFAANIGTDASPLHAFFFGFLGKGTKGMVVAVAAAADEGAIRQEEARRCHSVMRC